MTRTALDAALLLDTIAGYDPEDPTSLQASYEPVASRLENLPPGLRIGIAREFFLDDLDVEVATAFDAAIEMLFRDFGNSAG